MSDLDHTTELREQIAAAIHGARVTGKSGPASDGHDYILADAVLALPALSGLVADTGNNEEPTDEELQAVFETHANQKALDQTRMVVMKDGLRAVWRASRVPVSAADAARIAELEFINDREFKANVIRENALKDVLAQLATAKAVAWDEGHEYGQLSISEGRVYDNPYRVPVSAPKSGDDK